MKELEMAQEVAKEILNPDGTLKLLRAVEYDKFPFEALRYFCHFYARYLLPTAELVEFIKAEIGREKAIEIGSGSGDLGQNLGIIMTDNHMQEWPEIQTTYAMTQQPTIKYGENVLRFDALEAVSHFHPKVVVGAWITHWVDPNKPAPQGGGNMYGIKEDEILKLVDKYILVGAQEIHKYKAIMKLPHREIDGSYFIRSRRKDNKIWIWEN